MIRDTIDSYKNVRSDSPEASIIRKMEDIYQKLQVAFAKGAMDAGKNFQNAENTTNEGGVRYHSQSKKSLEDKYYARLIDQWDGEDHGGAFRVCSPSSALLTVGIPNVDIWFDQSKASKQLKSKVEVDKKILKSIPDVLQNPIVIAESYDNSVVVFGKLYDTWGHPIVVALRVNSTDRRNHITLANKIRSVGTRNTDLDKLLADSAILYLNENKKETNNWFNALGRSTPFGGTRFGLIRSIAFNLPEVKKDSQGKHLTAKQKKYFADSKERDANGNLRVMYRGDLEEVTVFDRKKSKTSNLYGRGFYYTSEKSQAGQYGIVRAFYLNTVDPLMPGQHKITKDQMLRFLEAIENDSEDYDLYNYGEGATAQSVLETVWGKGDFEMLQDVSASAIGDLVAAVELFNEINGTTYDSIRLHTETVIFNSNQAKLTTNKNPTDNPDIRYSIGQKTDGAVQALLEKENDALREDVARLKELLKLQGRETHGTRFTASSVEAAARMLKKNAGAKGDTKALTKLLSGFYEYIAKTKVLTWENVREKAKPIANWLMDHVEHGRSNYNKKYR